MSEPDSTSLRKGRPSVPGPPDLSFCGHYRVGACDCFTGCMKPPDGSPAQNDPVHSLVDYAEKTLDRMLAEKNKPTPLQLSAGLDTKLAVFDEYAKEAVDYIIDWFTNHRSDLIALARGRHVEGHYRYGNKNFLEWSTEEILAQAAQEGADKIVYVSRVLYRNATGNS